MARLPFVNVASGWHPFAPARSLRPDQGPCWRHLNNLRWQNGVLQARRSVRELPGSPTQPPLDYTVDVRVELPLWIFQAHTGGTVSSGGVSHSEVGTILVTTTDIYAHNASGWAVLTPTYTTGTVTWSSASLTVIGTGTAWNTDAISPGNFIKLGSEWIGIASIGGDTRITLTTMPSTSGGGTYEIRRTFNDTKWASGASYLTPRASIFATMHNGDLYVAGTSLGGSTRPAVVKVEDPLSVQTTSYLTASSSLTRSLDVIPITEIHGLLVLQDGRVLIACTDGSSSQRVARLRYSSHTDQTVWTSSPGGFVDDVSGGIGKMTALGRVGGTVTIHYEDAISVGLATGQDDPPLEIRSTRATHGCACPRTLRVAAGGEAFMDSKGVLRVFDGSSDSLLSAAFRDIVGEYDFSKIPWIPHGYVDPFRDEYQVWLGSTPSAVSRTYCLSVSTVSGEARREHYPFAITAIGNEYLAAPGLAAPIPSGDHVEASAVIASSYSSGAPLGPLAILRESYGEDDTSVITHTTGADELRAETDELDFGDPDTHQAITRIVIRMRKPVDSLHATNSEEIEVSLSPDGGESYPSSMKSAKTFTYSGAGGADTQAFYFPEESALTWKMRIEPTTSQRLIGAIEWIDFDIETILRDPVVA